MTDRADSPGSLHATQPTTLRVILAYFSVFIFWGSTYLAIRVGVQDVPPALFAAGRFLIAGGVLMLYGMLRRARLPSREEAKRLAIVGLLLLVGGNGLVVWAEQWIHSGLAALIIASVPLFMSSLDAIIPGGHRLSLVGWSGIILGFGGVAVLVSPGLGMSGGEVTKPEGIVALIVASFFWSAGSVYAKRRPVGGGIYINAGTQMLAAGVVLALIGVFSGEVGQLVWTGRGVFSLFYLVLFGSIIGFTSYAYLLRHVPPARASTYAYVNPVVAVFLGAIILAEPVDSRTVIAALIILGGVGLVQFSRMRSPQ